jgi:hypothetical protein
MISVLPGHVVLVTDLGGGAVGEPHHPAPHHQRRRHEPQAAQRRLDGVLEQQADDPDRQRPQDDRPPVPVVRVPPRAGPEDPPEPGGDDPDQVPAQEDHRREHRTRLDDRGERGDVRVVDRIPQQLLRDGQVTGAGDRQELGDPLDRTQQHRFEDVQADPVP